MLTEFKKRHDYTVTALNNMNGNNCLSTDGTFYLFPNINKILIRNYKWKDDVDFAEALLVDKGVAVIPGTAFGLKDHIRLSIAASDDNLRSALDRIKNFIA